MAAKQNVTLVTGGSRGIGRAICLGLAARGVALAVNYVSNPEAAEEVVALLGQQGVTIVDARDTGQYTGETVRGTGRRGHQPHDHGSDQRARSHSAWNCS